MSSQFSRDSVAPCTVFVVDDDCGVRDSLRALLSSHGMEVETYRSTKEFCAAYRPRSRTCLILDHHLEGSTGLAFLGSDEWGAIRIPVILVTGEGNSVLRRQALEAGVTAYLEKPVDAIELVDAIYDAVTAA